MRSRHGLIGVLGLFAAAPTIAQVVSVHGWVENDPRDLASCNLPVQFEDRSFWGGTLWTGGNVYYEFDPAVTQQNRDRTRIALNELETVADLRFIPRASESNYIYVQNGGGNSSFVGMIGGAQALNMVSWSWRYIIEHEFLHALGVWHEQQRQDRETYVTIVSANIQSGFEGNFNIRSGSVVGPFDFESIMLYDDCSFSTCCPAGSTCGCSVACATILAQPAYAAQQNLMGNRNYLSQGDKDGLVARYGASVDDEYEENDSPATAASAPLSTTHTLRLIDIEDYFRVVLAAPGMIAVNAAGNIWTADSARLRLTNSSGSQIVLAPNFSDPDGDGVFTTSINYVAPSAGTYLVRMTRSLPHGGDYTLRIDAGCDAIDFNNDGLFPDTADIDDFLGVFSGGACSNDPNCNDIDFNNDGLFPDTADIDALLSVFAGGACV
jgi:hypothetical protein